ncbi:hypothetical protein FSP39_001339 [Pinctada imbricata]|uniref:Uncharacterized protein n=1 Tax=Pinctada imbricata TaxID=66713 RepID=A0AA88Y6W2_PINIB|nr:hypothetical protein FSP39_001339 [Pinctada imbricata]
MPTSSTSQLKPIQPKPTKLGDQPAVNPVLLDLNRDKKLKPKKKLKDKEQAVTLPTASVSSSQFSTSNSTFSSTGKKPPVKLDGNKHEPQGVIKVAPIVASKPIESNIQKSEVSPLPRTDTEIKHFGANVGVIAAQVQPMKGIDLSPRPPDQQPSVLKVTPSLHIPSSDSNKNITDDVQSPAYSDISDANDAGSPSPMPRSESPQVKMEESLNKPKESVLPSAHVSGEGQSNFGVYSQYYGQSNYLMSNLPHAHSPSTSGGIQKPPIAAVQGKDRGAVGVVEGKANEAQNRERKEENKEEKKDGSSSKMEGIVPLSHPEYHQLQHQKWVQQQRMYIQTLPHHAQYQYMAAYGPFMDPTYHMHMMSTDPYYRQHFEKMLDEQRRAQDGGPPRNESEAASRPSSRSSMDFSQGQRSSSAGPSGADDSKSFSGRMREEQRRPSDLSISDSRDRSKEKASEINQPPKDSVDKSYLESSDPYKMSHQRIMSEEQQRRIMFQKQKLIEQQKREEQRKAEGDNKVTDFVNKNSASASSSSERRDMKKDVNRPDLIKREVDQKSKSNLEMPESKSAVDEKNRSNLINDKQRALETPKGKVNLINKASSPHTPSSSMPVSTHSPSMGPGSPYATPFMYHSQYMQSPPYSHMQFDPMYRGVNPSMMYAPAGPYLHPTQLGYHVGVEENMDKDKLPMGSTSKVPNESDSKISDSPYIGGASGHKIHELQEKGRPSPRTGSPVAGKGDGGHVTPTSLSGSLDKNRDFSNSPPIQRHVHSHHHTHVVEAAYPVYPYTGMLPGTAPPPPQQPPPPGSSMPHSSFSHQGPK